MNNKYNNKYTQINKKYLAEALSFLGFRYYKFNDDGQTVYSFENTEKFSKALVKLLQLRDELR